MTAHSDPHDLDNVCRVLLEDVYALAETAEFAEWADAAEANARRFAQLRDPAAEDDPPAS